MSCCWCVTLKWWDSDVEGVYGCVIESCGNYEKSVLFYEDVWCIRLWLRKGEYLLTYFGWMDGLVWYCHGKKRGMWHVFLQVMHEVRFLVRANYEWLWKEENYGCVWEGCVMRFAIKLMKRTSLWFVKKGLCEWL